MFGRTFRSHNLPLNMTIFKIDHIMFHEFTGLKIQLNWLATSAVIVIAQRRGVRN